MTTSYGALCNDFYINQKLALKMPLPSDRESLLHFFDRVRKGDPSMNQFRRFDSELSLESPRTKDMQYKWVAMRETSIRSGYINPNNMAEGYTLHKLLLEMAPYHLSISPLDVDHLELTFGFDLECDGDQDRVVAEALFGDSPLSQLAQVDGSKLLNAQPMVGLSLSKHGDLQAFFDVKTRRRGKRGSTKRSRSEPISIYLTVRQYGPINEVEDLPEVLQMLTHHAENLATDKVVPHLLTPIARLIAGSSK